MKTINNLIEFEERKRLYDYIIGNVPIWYIFRYDLRQKWLKSNLGMEYDTNPNDDGTRKRVALKVFLHSLMSIVKICFGKKFDNVFLGCPRLDYLNGMYVDRFTDPVIDGANLKDSSCILQISFRTIYKKFRYHSDICYSIESLYLVCHLLAMLSLRLHVRIKGDGVINQLFQDIEKDFGLDENDRYNMHLSYRRFKMYICGINFLYKRLSPRRIFFSMRDSQLPMIYCAHCNRIPIYEFQHGVTFNTTITYGGRNETLFTPDAFLAFGSIWNGTQFGIDSAKIINVGWAFKDFLKTVTVPNVKENAVLLVSSSEVTQAMLSVAKELADTYKEYNFEIRCHPMEKYSERQMEIVNNTPNMVIADNKEISYIALGHYNYVLGATSTMLYEAMSMGKKVGRLDYGGLWIERIPGLVNDGFFYLKSKDDFLNFILYENNAKDDSAYSDFKPEILEKLQKKCERK